MEHTEGFSGLLEESRARVREISVAAARERMNHGANSLMFAKNNEWEGLACGRRPPHGARISSENIETAIPDKNAELILYCGGGFRSALAHGQSAENGYTNVFSMDEAGVHGRKRSAIVEFH